MSKYFSRIISRDVWKFSQLRKYDYDIFRNTAKIVDNNEYSVSALISVDEISRLADSGYVVLIEKPEEAAIFKPSETSMLGSILEDEESALTGYLTAVGIEASIEQLAETYDSICEVILLPNPTHEGRRSRVLKLCSSNHGGSTKPGIFLLAGAHARELVNPDLLIHFVSGICKAYATNSDFNFNEVSIPFEKIKLILEQLEIFVLPLLNPDGREHVQSPFGERMWRKNRNPNPGLRGRGVDLNRNFDFLWESGVGTSVDSGSNIYRGLEPGSEPEIQNVIHVFDTYPNILGFLDIHSYSELILYPWGDDDNQTHNRKMNFMNVSYDGLRGALNDSQYREFIPADDQDWYVRVGERMQSAILGVRGRQYSLRQSSGLYPTTATSIDYSYARFFRDSSDTKIYSLTLETGREFQPPFSEARQIMQEIFPAITEFCLSFLEA